ncbi:hypothetical protein [Streptomyces sp. NPDC014623]
MPDPPWPCSYLLRRVLPWSLGPLLVMCLVVTARSTAVPGWTLP